MANWPEGSSPLWSQSYHPLLPSQPQEPPQSYPLIWPFSQYLSWVPSQQPS